MRKNTKKKIAPVLVAILAVAVMVPIILVALALMGDLRGIESARAALIFLAVYIAGAAAVLVCVLAVTRQRLKEIDRGEEEDAKKY